MEKLLKVNEEIYFRCNKCKQIVSKPLGAITHANKTHNLSLKIEGIGTYFSVVKNPPKEIVQNLKKKRTYQSNWRGRVKPAVSDSMNWKCNACGIVVGKRNSLYSHCTIVHKKPYSEIGGKQTKKPPSHPGYYNSSKGKQANLAKLLEHMPQVIKVSDAKVVDDGVILDVQFKIPTAYVASIIVPTLTS